MAVALPPHWSIHHDDEGYPFYWNEQTDESVWELEEVLKRSKMSKQRSSQVDDPAIGSMVSTKNRSESYPLENSKGRIPPYEKIPEFQPSSSSPQRLKATLVQSHALTYAGQSREMRAQKQEEKCNTTSPIRKHFFPKTQAPLVPQEIAPSPKPVRKAATSLNSEYGYCPTRLPRYSDLYGPKQREEPPSYDEVCPSPSTASTPKLNSTSHLKTNGWNSASPLQRSSSCPDTEVEKSIGRARKPFVANNALKVEGSDSRIGLPVSVLHVAHFEADDLGWAKNNPNLEKKGYLHRLTTSSSWDSRFFIVKKGFICTFKDSSENHLVDQSSLKDSVIEVDKKCGKKFAIHLVTEGKINFVIAAPTEKEMKEWMCALKINGSADATFANKEVSRLINHVNHTK